MTQWVVTNGEGMDVFVESEDQLVDALGEMDGAARRSGELVVAVLAADIDAVDTPYLSLVVGGDESVLVYEAGVDGPESGFSAGSHTGDVAPVFARYGTGTTEFQRWMVVPKHAAMAAARELFRTGTRPTNVAWADFRSGEVRPV